MITGFQPTKIADASQERPFLFLRAVYWLLLLELLEYFKYAVERENTIGD